MSKPLYVFTVKLTPRGKHFIIVTSGEEVIYVTRKAYSDGAQALAEAKTYLEKQETKDDGENNK